MQNSLLNNVTIALVDTKTPANIGAAARCMMNFGINHLILVNPPGDPSHDAVKLAAGAQQILESAVVFSSLREAIRDQGLVIGVSRHKGRMRRNTGTAREVISRTLPLLARNKACFVFGNEVNGLDLDHLSLCHKILSIPSSQKFPSLNLSHAVMVVAYELFVSSQKDAWQEDRRLATGADLELFFSHLQQTLEITGFLDSSNAGRMMFSLRQIFGRSRLDERDVRILRGIFSTIDRTTRR